MLRIMRHLRLFGLLALPVLLVACGAVGFERVSDDAGALEQAASESRDAGGYYGAQGPPGPGMAPAPFPTPAPYAPVPEPEFREEPDVGESGDDGALTDEDQSTETEVAALAAQERIIVRTVRMDVVVDDVQGSMDDIADLAQQTGGWVVSSDRSRKHRGTISFRVPAAQLDRTVAQLRDLAVEVESEVSTSQDVTDEYVDTTARIKNLQATEEALIALLEKAEDVEDALAVQRELTRVQSEVEALQGRIKFLEETSAFSLVTVGLRLSPTEIDVDAGDDQTASLSELVRFRAEFEAPEDIEDYLFTWDFGDGSPRVQSDRTAPATEAGRRFTTTVTHFYQNEKDSPYIAEVEITGTGDGGVVEGSDTFIVTVTKLPTIQLFAGENQVVEEGNKVEFESSFTRPEGLTNITFRWDFGDGSTLVEGTVEEDTSKITATHTYENPRPFPYEATLTVRGDIDGDRIEATDTVSVFVGEADPWVIVGWSPVGTMKAAVRALSGVGIALGFVLIFGIVLSPAWVPALYGARKARDLRRARRGSSGQRAQQG